MLSAVDRQLLIKKHKANPVIATGNTRKRWLFWTQYEYEGPFYCGGWQTPYNIDEWPRGRWWSYQAPHRGA